MAEYNIYKDISQRTQGDIYIGVVGPVRTGKSTFIKKFMDLLVIPNIDDDFKRDRAQDELPQSAGGRTIMTTEPKFVPNESINITLNDNASFNVRMIDCVGYIVNSSTGYVEDNMPRMVHTPWYEDEIPFEKAAETGTKKVISEHSTIGLVITTDGSITDIPRFDYVEPETRVINELKAINKPFIVLINSVNPLGKDAQDLKAELEQKHNVPVMVCNCIGLSVEDINSIIEKVLYEFPIKEVCIDIPEWITNLDDEHWLKTDIITTVKDKFKDVTKIRHAKDKFSLLCDSQYVENVNIDEINLGNGCIKLSVQTPEKVFYKVLSETSGFEIDNDDKLISLLADLSKIKKQYDKISYAMHEVEQKGYGIVTPTIDELKLEEPEIVKQGSRYGVRLRASAPSIHMIKAEVETEVSPIVGSEKQSKELVEYLLSEFEVDPIKLWESNIFGKSLHELVNEGLNNKLYKMPDDAQVKLQETLEKIINEGSGGLICIIL